ncbi:equilibrative nucleoside transporter 1-like [Lineus longissimus]|uniref:equilibrative nucleoside transporter 1-like n=1 Tax=Lineus longissimus TaxID=88925 RepID=UPI002B4E255D
MVRPSNSGPTDPLDPTARTPLLEGQNGVAGGDTEQPTRRMNDEYGPKDRLRVVYGLFYLLGMGTLLPWNFFTTAKLYFEYKLRNTSLPDSVDYTKPEYQTELQVTFENYLAIAAMVPGVLFMFLNTAVTKTIRLKVRMVTSLIMMILLFVFTVILVKLDTDDWQLIFFIVTLCSVVIINASSAIMQGCLFGLASMFPEKYTQAVMGGQALGGTFSAVANLAAIAGASNAIESGFGFFLSAEAVLLISLVAYLLLPFSRFAKYHIAKCSDDDIRPTTANFDSLSPDQFPRFVRPNRPSSLLIVFRRIWSLGMSVFLTFAVTLSLYPAILSAINAKEKGSGNAWTDTFFSPVVCFLIFNVGDLVGRVAAGWVRIPRDGKGLTLPLLSIIRIAFIPLFMLCNVQPRTNLPVIFEEDYYPIIFMVFFSTTNGYVGTLGMMYGPSQVLAEDAEAAGSMMSFFLALGLCIGSLLSMAMNKLI